MKKYLSVLIGGVLAGIFIGLGVTVNLLVMGTSKVVGSLLFGIGLYLVIVTGSFLYTGKIGYVFDNKKSYLLDLLVGLVGNIIGIMSFCFLISLTRMGASLKEVAVNLTATKQNDSWYSILLLSIFCGFNVYLAVQGHKMIENPFGKVLVVFLAVSTFILCGFEHCIANVGYYTYAGNFNWKIVLYVIIMIIGNSIGSIALDRLLYLYKKLKNN